MLGVGGGWNGARRGRAAGAGDGGAGGVGGDGVGVREGRLARVVEVDGAALHGAAAVAACGRGVEVQLVALSAAPLVVAERVGRLLPAVAAEGVLGSGERLRG